MSLAMLFAISIGTKNSSIHSSIRLPPAGSVIGMKRICELNASPQIFFFQANTNLLYGRVDGAFPLLARRVGGNDGEAMGAGGEADGRG